MWSIFKKGDNFQHSNYTQITLLNVTYKILLNIILKRLNVYTKNIRIPVWLSFK
jgi:hypothetical protein